MKCTLISLPHLVAECIDCYVVCLLLFLVHIGDPSHWWAVPESETTSLFGSHAHLQNGSQVGYSESVPDVRDLGKLEQKQVCKCAFLFL